MIFTSITAKAKAQLSCSLLASKEILIFKLFNVHYKDEGTSDPCVSLTWMEQGKGGEGKSLSSLLHPWKETTGMPGEAVGTLLPPQRPQCCKERPRGYYLHVSCGRQTHSWGGVTSAVTLSLQSSCPDSDLHLLDPYYRPDTVPSVGMAESPILF